MPLGGQSHVYFMRPVGQAGPVKIGWSWLPSERLRVHQWWSPIPLELVCRTPGGEELEGQFHARFAADHMHGEWFAESAALTATIDAVNAGTFDFTSLPPRGAKLHSRHVSPASSKARLVTRQFQALKAYGVPIPEHVEDASRTYGYEPDEKARRRAIVAFFVEAHDHLLADARAAAKVKAAEDKAARKADRAARQVEAMRRINTAHHAAGRA